MRLGSSEPIPSDFIHFLDSCIEDDSFDEEEGGEENEDAARWRRMRERIDQRRLINLSEQEADA